MELQRRQITGGLFIVGGAAAYLWLMAANVVPTALELAGNLGVPATAPIAWIGLTSAAFAVVFGVDRALSHRR